jgi:hypothetical protein
VISPITDFKPFRLGASTLGASTQCATRSCGHGTAAGQLTLLADVACRARGQHSIGAATFANLGRIAFQLMPNQPRMSSAKSLVVIWKIGNN